MTLAHETPIAGPAQDIADGIAARVPVLHTDRLVLRAPRLGDFAAYAEIACGPRADSIGGPMSRDEAWDDFMRMTGLWLLRGHGVWVMETRDGAETAGFVLIGFEPGDAEPELGWFTTAPFEGKGLATEAARAVLRHAFGTLRLRTLVSYINPGNTRSRALARRLGAVPDGMLDGSEIWRHIAKEHAQ
ncbi:MAG: GNAT family N-acetyltransferase [Paracoccaceae bacterium]